MKKLINRAFIFLCAGLAAGVFYREFTKWNGFTGHTALSAVHPHLIALGAMLLLIAALMTQHMPLLKEKQFGQFVFLHTAGLSFAAVMMLVRGVTQVLGTSLPKGMDAAVSGLAGIAHLMLGTALALLFLSIKKALNRA